MNNWLKEKKQDFLFKIILFWIFPVISFFYSFVRANTRSSYLIFSSMAILFSLSFSLPSGRDVEGPGYDGQFYRQGFENYVNVTSYEFAQAFRSYITFDSDVKDFYFDSLAFYVSRITDNYHLLFMFSGIIFTYFCLKSFRFLTKEPNYYFSLNSIMLTILFLQNSLVNINGMRFWTTSWIAVYCVFQIFINKNKKYYLLALTTPFFHGSFFIFILVLMVFQVFKGFERIWIYLFSLSFVLSSFSIILLEFFSNSFQSYLPGNIINLINTYTDPRYVEEVNNASLSIITIILQFISNLYIWGIIVIFIKNSNSIKNNPKTKDLYLLLLVWLTIFNFLTFIPSLGGRFMMISYPIIAYVWLVGIKKEKYNIFLLFLPIAFSLNIYSQLYIYLQVVDVSFFYSNPIILLYKNLS